MLGPPWAIAAALVLVLGIAGAWLMYETRGTTLWFDEWLWALEYRDGLHTFIAPHNGHPTLVPFAIYRLLFATVGIDHSAPYRAIGIAGHLLVVALLYVYSARRAGVGCRSARGRVDPAPRSRLAEHHLAAADRLAHQHRVRPRRPPRARPARPRRATSPRVCCS